MNNLLIKVGVAYAGALMILALLITLTQGVA